MTGCAGRNENKNAMIFNRNHGKWLKEVGRKTTSFMLQYVKNHCKGGKSMENTRRIYIDNIRWITVCIVILYHVIYMFNGVQTFGVIGPFKERQWQDAFQYLVYPWFMALLFVVSGMAARYYLERHTAREYLTDKTRKLLVPSTIGLFVFQWILGYFNMKISGAFENFQAVPGIVRYVIMAISGIGVLWYIQVLWIFSMLLLLVRKIEKDRLWNLGAKVPVWLLVLMTVCVYGAAQILNTPVVTVYRFGIYGFCFFAGYFLFSHDEVVERLCRWGWWLLTVAVVVGIFYTVRYFGENYAIEPVVNTLSACVYCWFAILAILSIMKQYGDRENAVTRWMIKKSWGLYIFHYLPLAMAACSLKCFAPGLPAGIVYLLVTISSFGGALLLNAVISRIPWIRWCVLGIKKEKTNV